LGEFLLNKRSREALYLKSKSDESSPAEKRAKRRPHEPGEKNELKRD